MATNWGEVFRGPVGAAAINSGTSLLGGAIAGKGMQKQSEAQIKENRRRDALTRQNELFDTQLGQENKDFSARMADKRSLDSQTLGAMGNSPLQFQADRMRMNAIADALQGGGPANLSAHMAPFARGMDMSKFRPSAEAELPYWNQVAQASGGRFGGANLGSLYGGTARKAADQTIGATTAGAGAEWQQDWDNHDAATQETLRQAGISNDAELKAAIQEAQKQPGGSKWKILAKVGIIAGGAIATAMTGGIAAPIMIGALSGAGTGALDGGLKGALTGAAMGGAMGGIGGIGGAAKSAAGAAKMGLGQATKQALSNPGTLLRMGGAATPGAAGAIMNTAGGLLEPRMTGKWGAKAPAAITPQNLATPTKTGMSTEEMYGGSPNLQLIQKLSPATLGVKGLDPSTLSMEGTNFFQPPAKATALKRAVSGGGSAKPSSTVSPSTLANQRSAWGLDDIPAPAWSGPRQQEPSSQKGWSPISNEIFQEPGPWGYQGTPGASPRSAPSGAPPPPAAIPSAPWKQPYGAPPLPGSIEWRAMDKAANPALYGRPGVPDKRALAALAAQSGRR
jgi:hypothetical protein